MTTRHGEQRDHTAAGLDPLAALRTPADPACDVYLTGTVFLDIIFTGLDSAPVRGTESWARGMGSSPGGVANMATALARLGLRTSLAAAFGDDHYGEYCWDALEQGEGIDLSLSRTVPGWHSPVTVSMAYEGERTMVSHGHEAPPPEPAPDCPPPARAAVASLTPGRAEWIAQAARKGTRIFADVGWDDTGRWDPADLADLEHCEAFLPNAEEAMRYTRTDCPRAAARALTDRVPLAVVTLGAEGAYAVDGAHRRERRGPGHRGGGARPDRRRRRVRRRVRHRHPRRLAARRPARLRRADRRPVGAGVRRLALRARLVGDRGLVAARPGRRRPGPGGPAPVRLPRGACCPRRPGPGRCAGPSRPSASAAPHESADGPDGPRTDPRGKALGLVSARSYAGIPEVVEQREPCNGRYVQATEPAHDSDTHSPDPSAGAGASPVHRPRQASDGDGPGFG